MLYPYHAFPLWYLEHSRDITLLIVLLSCTTPACFSAFYRCAMVPTLVENFSVYLFVNFFFVDIIMTGEPTHTASEMVPRAPAMLIIV